MSKVSSDKILAEAKRMFDAPADNWRIEDIKRLADRAGLTVRSPTRGSHYTISSPHLEQILPVPFKRPIKAPYVRKFAAMVKQHIAAMEEDDAN